MDKERLKKAGIDYDGGVHRFADSAALYEKYLLKFFSASELPALRQALERGDWDAAFRAAHNMKGGAGNLSVTALYERVCALVDALRAGSRDPALLTLCAEAEALYETARRAVKEEYDGRTD